MVIKRVGVGSTLTALCNAVAAVVRVDGLGQLKAVRALHDG